MSGYEHARDQHYYGREDVERLIECIWDADFILRPKPEQEIRPKGDPALGGNLLVMVADVRQAWAKAGLQTWQRETLACRYYYDLPLEETAEVMGYESVADAAQAADEAMTQMIDYLGGAQ